MRIIYAGTPEPAVAPLEHLAAAEGIEIAAVLTRTDARDVETRTHGLEEAFLQLTEEKA